ncbi:MAG: hypothetical protein ACI3W6_00635 [Clostridia bacterium]
MNAIFDFIMDNIALLVGLLVLVSSVHSARKKKRKAKAESENPAEKPSVSKSFKQIMAEIESELDEKPWDEDDEPEKPRRKKAFSHPYAPPTEVSREVNIPAAVLSEIPPLQPTERAAVEEMKETVEKQLKVIKKKRNNPFSGSDLVTAVVMSEILGKPKALRRD